MEFGALYGVLYGYPGDWIFKSFTSLEAVQAFVGGLRCPYSVFDFIAEAGEYIEFYGK